MWVVPLFQLHVLENTWKVAIIGFITDIQIIFIKYRPSSILDEKSIQIYLELLLFIYFLFKAKYLIPGHVICKITCFGLYFLISRICLIEYRILSMSWSFFFLPSPPSPIHLPLPLDLRAVHLSKANNKLCLCTLIFRFN